LGAEENSSNSLRVRPATYDAVRRGDSVNAGGQNPGTLGIRWYYLRGVALIEVLTVTPTR